MKIPLLLVDDEQLGKERFDQLLDLLSREDKKLREDVDVRWIRDYSEALEIASRGTFPLAIVDLNLMDSQAGVGHDIDRFPGLQLINQIRKLNSATITAAFTGFAEEAGTSLVGVPVEALLNKLETNANLLKTLQFVLEKALKAFNFRSDVDGKAAVTYAFGTEEPPFGTLEQWDLCLRRFLRHADDVPRYSPLSRGRSGAGVVTVRVKRWLPLVLKLDRYKNLTEELWRYEKYVKRFIPRCAVTGAEDLSQAGEVGTLAYSLVGAEDNPVTLSKAINDFAIPPDSIARAIREHFDVNCRHWLKAVEDLETTDDIAAFCRRYYSLAESPMSTVQQASQSYDVDEFVASAIAPAKGAFGLDAGKVCSLIREAALRKYDPVLSKPEVTVHGDLNANNLIWDKGTLWMIDFARTGVGPRLLDFAKLEASIKYDVLTKYDGVVSQDKQIEADVAFENEVLGKFDLDPGSAAFGGHEGLHRKAAAIAALRQSAGLNVGHDSHSDFWMQLFFVTVKHIEYLCRDMVASSKVSVPLAHAVFSAMRLAQRLEEI